MQPEPNFTRTQLADLLASAVRNVCRQSGADTAFSAVVMRELNQVVREAAQKPKGWTLEAAAFGPAVFPTVTHDEWGKLKPRDFFQAFPEIVKLEESPSGDILRWLHAEEDRADLANDRATAKEQLRETMRAMAGESGKLEIACSALKLRLSKDGAPDEKRRLGYKSFREWLEDCTDILTFVDFRSGGRVRLLAPGEIASKPMVVPPSTTRGVSPLVADPSVERMKNAYIIVESGSIWHSLKEILGREPDSATAPNWDIVMKFFRMRWPADAWKGLYFLYAPKERAETLDGFFKYLADNGFQPIHLYDRIEQGPARLRGSLIPKIQEQVDAVALRNGHVVVITHNGAIAANLLQLVENVDRRGNIAVCGLLDHMDADLCRLRERGVEFFDIERDVRCFRTALPRFRPVPADQFDPTRYL